MGNDRIVCRHGCSEMGFAGTGNVESNIKYEEGKRAWCASEQEAKIEAGAFRHMDAPEMSGNDPLTTGPGSESLRTLLEHTTR